MGAGVGGMVCERLPRPVRQCRVGVEAGEAFGRVEGELAPDDQLVEERLR